VNAGSEGRSTGAKGLHPAAWLAWLSGGCAAVFLTSNPLYLSLGFLASCGVYVSVRDSAKGRALTPFVVMGLVFAALSLPFNVLTGSAGATVLTTLPELRSPDWFGGVILGGDITAEAIVLATSRAIMIGTLVLLAASFNASIDHFRLVRLAPRALSQVALTLTIAILVVPESIAYARAVAEAQRLRGRRVRGARAIAGLLLPTLQGALERSVQRAESLDARGFGGGGAPEAMATLVGVAGLGLLGWGGFAHYYFGPGLTPSIAMGAGGATVVISLMRGGYRRTRLRADPWSTFDVVVAGASMLSVALVLALRITDAGDVAYLPYPESYTPAFHGAGAAAFLLLLAPLFASAPARIVVESRA
jgi:energy-coupling factor transport system permease protein